jgi:hypothetical protein
VSLQPAPGSSVMDILLQVRYDRKKRDIQLYIG